MPAERAADAGRLMLRLADPDHALAGVRLQLDVRMPPDLLEFRRAGEHWELAIDPPAGLAA